MRYYIWVDEHNKVWTNPRPLKEGMDINTIFATEKHRSGKVALAIGTREYLEQNYEMRSDAFKEEKQ